MEDELKTIGEKILVGVYLLDASDRQALAASNPYLFEALDDLSYLLKGTGLR